VQRDNEHFAARIVRGEQVRYRHDRREAGNCGSSVTGANPLGSLTNAVNPLATRSLQSSFTGGLGNAGVQRITG
jgi:hypothetical protein